MRLAEFIKAHGVKQADLARLLRVGRSAIHKKLRGERPWYVGEAQTVLNYLRHAFPGEDLTLDSLFAAKPKRQRKAVA